MNFVDYTLTRLADDAERDSMLSQDSLRLLLEAGYDSETLAIFPPFEPIFERFSLGVSLARRHCLEGRWGELSDPQRHQLRIDWEGDLPAPLRVDALWQGAIAAQVGGERSRIERVVVRWPDPGRVDAAIVAASGSLPSDPLVLEARRRAQLLAFWQSNALQPDAFTPATVDAWLAEVGAGSLAEVLSRGAAMPSDAQLQVGFSDPLAQPPELRPMPISVGLLVRDAPLDIATLLAESRRVRTLLRDQGAERPPIGGASGQVPVVVAWVVPAAVFDDADWPGSSTGSAEQRNVQRRLAASRWLAREAIGLVIPPPRVP